MKTIAFFTPQMIIGGAEAYIINKSNWLTKHGYSVVIVSAGGIWVTRLPQGALHVTLDGLNVPPYAISKKELKQISNTIISIIKEYKIDIIEAHNSFPVVYLSIIQKKIRAAVLLNVLSELSYDRNPLLWYATRRLDKKGLFYTLNEDMKRYIRKKSYSLLKRSTIIPIPVHYDTSLVTSRNSYILSVCRMYPEKMYIQYLIKDFIELLREKKIDQNFKLIVVGDGPLLNEVKERSYQLNPTIFQKSIIFKGFCEGKELDILYSNCDLYVGMGTTLLSGALYGKPSIIAGSVPATMPYAWGFWGVKDYDTISANSSDNNEKNTFASLIEQILNNDNLYAEVSEIAKKQATKKYNLDNIMNIWEKEYIKASKTKKAKFPLIRFAICALRTIKKILR